MSNASITIMSWNIQGESGITDQRLADVIDFIGKHSIGDGGPDVLILQAVPNSISENTVGETEANPTIEERLHDELGYPNNGIASTCDWASRLDVGDMQPHAELNHNRGNLTASKWETERVQFGMNDDVESNFNTNFPEKMLQTRHSWNGWGRLEIWNVGVVAGASYGEEKIKIISSINSYIRKRAKTSGRKRALILGGDFNTPNEETADGQAVPYGYSKDKERGGLSEKWYMEELRLLKGGHRTGLVDTIRYLHGYDDLNDERPTHYSHLSNGVRKRIDHLFVDGNKFTPVTAHYSVKDMDFDDIPSDHSPLVAELSYESN